MSTKRKLLVALAVFLLVFGGLFYWIWRGTPAQHTLDQLSGKDPVLVEPRAERIPSVAIAKVVGWGASEAPTVNRRPSPSTDTAPASLRTVTSIKFIAGAPMKPATNLLAGLP